MKKAAVGFRVHSGWTALVAVSLEKGVPTVLSRQRLQLVETFSFKFRQPFHTAETMRFKDASKFISGVEMPDHTKGQGGQWKSLLASFSIGARKEGRRYALPKSE